MSVGRRLEEILREVAREALADVSEVDASDVHGLDDAVRQIVHVMDRGIQTKAEDIIGLNDFVRKIVDGRCVDANDVIGLYDLVDARINEHKLEADDIGDLEDFVQNAIDEHEIETDDITGLEDFVVSTVKDMDVSKNEEIETDDITGLEEFVDERIAQSVKDHVSDKIDSINWKVKLGVDIAEAIDSIVQTEIRTFVASQEFKTVIQTEVRAVLSTLVAGLFNAAVPVAQPVTPTKPPEPTKYGGSINPAYSPYR